ncbi:hypothetical protein GCM10009753_51750 [Streptantibioticus ferralitis]
MPLCTASRESAGGACFSADRPPVRSSDARTANRHTVAPPQGWDSPAPYQRHDVAVITVAPGLTAARFRAMTTPAPAAVILRTYGVGRPLRRTRPRSSKPSTN